MLGRHVLGSDPICNQPLVVACVRIQRHHHALAHLRMRAQPCLDLAQLDAEATNLDLVIVTSDKLDRAVGTPTPQIAAAIHPCRRIGAEWIREETFCGQFLAIQISTRHTIATDIQLAHHSDRNWRTVPIENVDLRVRDRTSDRKTSQTIIDLHDLISGGDGRDFRGAVTIQEMLRAVAIQNLRHHTRINRITTGKQITQVAKGLFHAIRVLMEQPCR